MDGNDYFRFEGANAREISFPLGGIGTGCIGLSGSGRLVDWEIANRPNKGGFNGFSHFAVRAQKNGKVLDARLLHGPFHGRRTGDPGAGESQSFGFGVRRENLSGLPHFSTAEFTGCYPVADMKFTDPSFPGNVSLTAYNPFIPGNADDSGLPLAMFEWTLGNTTEHRIDYTLVGNLANPAPMPHETRHLRRPSWEGLHSASVNTAKDAPQYGEVLLATDSEDINFQRHWYRGSWFDALQVYWDELVSGRPFSDRNYPDGLSQKTHPELVLADHSLLAATTSIAPGATEKIRFLIAWYFPVCEKYWKSGCGLAERRASPDATWKNYYATLWEGADEVADYVFSKWESLREQTVRFRNCLFSSTLPVPVLDAVSANLSILKTPTVLRLENGALYGFEGCNQTAGCCEGSCLHVWNYQQALAFLFPALERSMRDLEFAENQLSASGGISFRLQLPLGSGVSDDRPCVDGQFGTVLKAYRDWKISGADDWLEAHWADIKKAIEYAWSEANPDKWDPDKTGVIRGRQHHTLDMELFGPNPWLTGFYLGALLAAEKMAAHLGDVVAAKLYGNIYRRGRAWVNERLFNGDYFQQSIDLDNRELLSLFAEGPESNLVKGSIYDLYWSEEHGELKYQVADGCLIDQVLAQWHSSLYGLGELFDPEKLVSSLNAIYEYNYKSSLADIANPCRVFGLEDEAGTIICSWPRGPAPAIPLPYAQETMHGFEYAFGCSLMQADQLEKGVTVFKAVRDRYRGHNRNPWNEMECGSNYARSMAAYAALPTLSGFEFDMPDKHIGFSPKLQEKGGYQSFWSLCGAWGNVYYAAGSMQVEVLWGSMDLASIGTGMSMNDDVEAYFNDVPLSIELHGKNTVSFTPVQLSAGDNIKVTGQALSLDAAFDVGNLSPVATG